jgi:hypothetical protein
MFQYLSAKKWEELQNLQYNGLVFINVSYVVFYFLVIFGILADIPKVVSGIHYFVILYVALYLIVYYNPYLEFSEKYKFKEVDRKIIFTSGILLLLSFLSKSLQFQKTIAKFQNDLGIHMNKQKQDN